MTSIILASSSPRRREILDQIGIPYEVIPPEVDETPAASLQPTDLAVALARRKAKAVHGAASVARRRAGGRSNRRYILSADTVVAVDSQIMGKPRDREQARGFLSALSGRRHSVHTAIAVISPYADTGQESPDIAASCESTDVYFADLSEDEIAWYLDTEEWLGVAGGYRIQERGACLIERIDGSYSAVVGLPIRLVYSMLAANGFAFT